jgi:DNA repair exonuclease SbcCD ATPase subunit
MEQAGQSLADLQSQYEALDNAHAGSQQAFQSAEHAFLREQAGLLAQQLSPDAPCPVCGALHHPAPAQLAPDAPSEQQVQAARALAEEAAAKRNTGFAAVSAAQEKLHHNPSENISFQTDFFIYPAFLSKKEGFTPYTVPVLLCFLPFSCKNA